MDKMSLIRITESKQFEGPHQNENTILSGATPADAAAAMIMIHGRGARAESILSLRNSLNFTGKFMFAAPQASGNTWYPYSFLSPIKMNEPGLTSGLQVIFDTLATLEKENMPKEKIILLGFSQGACLVSEFVARHPDTYGGIVCLSGGLVGEKINPDNYTGDLSGSPFFIGCSDADPHIPLERVTETEHIYRKLGANITKRIYPGMGHSVNEDELECVNGLMQKLIKN